MPYASWVMAELGADVIKIERPPGGDVARGWDARVRGLSTGFVFVNANKRDLAVDLGKEAGREVVRRLCLDADVLLENFAPGAAARLGFGPDAVRAANPRIVYCSLSGYGQDGPFRDRKAYDLLVQGEAGLIATTGYPEAPAKVGIPITDLVAGTNAALAVVTALLERERTGCGQVLDVAMFDSALSWLGYYPQHYWHGGGEPPRSGMRHQYLSPNGPFLAADGRYVILVIGSDRDWQVFCRQVVERPEWEADPRFRGHRDRSVNKEALDELVTSVIGTRPVEEWEARMEAAGLAYGRVRGIAEVLSHPQLESRGLVVDAESPVGALQLLRFPLASPGLPRRIPALGEHTDELLAEAGYTDAEIAALREQGVVA